MTKWPGFRTLVMDVSNLSGELYAHVQAGELCSPRDNLWFWAMGQSGEAEGDGPGWGMREGLDRT